MASVQCKNHFARDESFPAIANMPWFDQKKVVRAPARYKTHTTTVTTMANAGGNGPLTPQMRHQVPQRRFVRMDDNPPSKRYNFGGRVRGCMAIKVLLCSGNDALPQHQSVLRAIHPLTPPKIITACLGDLRPSSDDDGAERKASCGAQRGWGHFRRCRPWLVLVEMVVIGRWRLVASFFVYSYVDSIQS
jgi:hypothetical protein